MAGVVRRGGGGGGAPRSRHCGWAARLLLLLVVFQPTTGLAGEVWTAWSEWSECSFTCGRGVRSRYRECVGHTTRGLVRLKDPTCPGRDRQFVICENPSCPPGSDDEREAQCSEHNTDEVLNTLYHWVPFYGGPNPCELTCLARGYSFYYNFGHVRDGTPCKKHSEDLCVGGHCAKVGCDDHVGSNAELDDCGVCGGQNANCAFFRRTYDTPLPHKGNFGYTEVVKIPTGSTKLKVEDTSNNYLALADSSMTYIINGNWVIDWPGRYEMAGTTIYYGRSGPDNETITADGPIKEDLHLMLIFREKNPGVTYQFWFPGHKLDEIKVGSEPSDTKKAPVQTKGTKPPFKGQPPSQVPQEKNTGIYRPAYGKQLDASQRDHDPLLSKHPERTNNQHGKVTHTDSQKGKVIHANNQQGKDISNSHGKGHVTAAGYGDDAHYTVRTDGDKQKEGSVRDKTPKEDEVVPSDITHTQGWWEAIKQSKTRNPSRDVSPQLDDVSSASRQLRVTPEPPVSSTVTTSTTTTVRQRLPTRSGRVKARIRGGSRKRKTNTISKRPDSCPPCKKVKNRAKHFCQSQFAIHAKVLRREKVGAGNDSRYDVKVLAKYRDHINLLRREYIWVPNRCHCPRLHDNKDYILMGHLVTDAGTREGRLQLTRQSFVRAYNLANNKRMGNLIKNVNCDKYG